MADDIQRFFIAHMQKTAGTSLRDRFRNHFPIEAIYPNASDGNDARLSVISVDHLLAQWAVRGEEIRVLTGHFPLSVLDLIDADFVTVSVLRPPVERTLSYLRHQQKINVEDREKSLEEIYDDPFRWEAMIVNHMTRTLGLRTEDYGDGGVLTTVPYDDALLERAKAGLAGLDLFGLQPHFEDFCAELSARYQLTLGDPVRSNTTEPTDAPPGLVERIIADSPLDLALYDYAVELYEARRGDWLT